ncbi:MAG: hypothetical protein EPO24_07660 [Bacteroidetes bacterium]|nr:MAG: hypothetical protein EPO24_07660 [Bacteroidota bacterium]
MGKHNQYKTYRKHDEELIGMLQYIFITTKKYSVEKTARDLNMEYNDLYAFVSGNRTMPATLLVKLTVYLNDVIFFDTITGGTPLRVEFEKHQREHSLDLVKEALDVYEASGDFSKALKVYCADGKLTQEERMKIHTSISRMINELKDVQDVLNNSFGLKAM